MKIASLGSDDVMPVRCRGQAAIPFHVDREPAHERIGHGILSGPRPVSMR